MALKDQQWSSPGWESWIKSMHGNKQMSQDIETGQYMGQRYSPSHREKEKQNMDLQKVVTALAERLGLTIDHRSELVETTKGKHPWGGDTMTPSNFAQLRENVDDLQEIAMGIANHLKLLVTVEDGRKVTVEAPKEVPVNEGSTKRTRKPRQRKALSQAEV